MALVDPIGCGMWSLTPYDKCDFRCLYCCTRVQGASKEVVQRDLFLSTLRTKLDAVPEDDLIIMGAYCDAYPLLDEKLALARLAVEEVGSRERRFAIVTKSTTVLRDLDLLLKYRKTLRQVQISICSTDEQALRRLDPMAPCPRERFAVLHQLYEAGVPVDLLVLPWIPEVTDTEELIGRVPKDVEIVLAPLAMGVDSDSMKLLGTTYRREEVVSRYMAEYSKYGHISNTSWVKPTPPPQENDPMFRMPVLRI